MSYCRRAAQRDGPPFFSAGAQTPPEKWAREAPPADAESRHRAATSAEAFLDYSPGGQPEESPRPTASRTPPVAERQNYETFPSISSTVNYLLVLKKTIFLPTILRYFYIDTNVFLIRGRFLVGAAAQNPGAADSGKSAALPTGSAIGQCFDHPPTQPVSCKKLEKKHVQHHTNWYRGQVETACTELVSRRTVSLFVQ